jgi:hypothetical protein
LFNKAGHRIDIPATLEIVDNKYSQTSILLATENGARQLKSVQLGGTKSKIVFQP